MIYVACVFDSPSNDEPIDCDDDNVHEEKQLLDGDDAMYDEYDSVHANAKS